MDPRSLWKRPEVRFLVLYLLVVVASFTVVALRPVNDGFVEPYTSLVARMSGGVLGAFGENVTVEGCLVRSPRFAVTIYNGCNGLITSIIFIAGVLAFPAGPAAKIIGILGGLVVIQVINLVRIISLFYIGVFLPEMFDSSHLVIWQSVVILSGVALWIVWATRLASPREPGPDEGGGRVQ